MQNLSLLSWKFPLYSVYAACLAPTQITAPSGNCWYSCEAHLATLCLSTKVLKCLPKVSHTLCSYCEKCMMKFPLVSLSHTTHTSHTYCCDLLFQMSYWRVARWWWWLLLISAVPYWQLKPGFPQTPHSETHVNTFHQIALSHSSNQGWGHSCSVVSFVASL